MVVGAAQRVILRAVSPWNSALMTWRRTLVLLLVLGLGTAGAALLVVSAEMVLAVFLGVVLAVAVRPAMEALSRLGLSRSSATAAVFLALAACLVLAVALVVPVMQGQVTAFSASLPAVCQRGAQWVPHNLLGEQRLAEVVAACAQVGNGKDQIVSMSYLAWLPRAAWTATIILGVAFVWTRDRETLLRSSSMFVDESARDRFRAFFESIEERLGGFLRAQIALSVLVALVTAVFCLVCGVPNILLVVALAAVGEALPVVGPLLVGAFILVSVLGPQPDLLLWVVLFSVALRAVVDYLLMPYLVGKTADVNPLLLLLCVLALGTAGGFVGIAAAAPAAAVISLVLSLSVEHQKKPAGGDRSKWALLAYQAHSAALSARRLGRQRVGAGEDTVLEDAVESLALEFRQNIGSHHEERAS